MLGDEKMGFWDDDIEFFGGYEEPAQNIIDQVNVSQTPVPSGGEQLGVQSIFGTAATEYSIGEKYRSALFAAQSPEEFDAQVKMFKAELNAKQPTLLNFGTVESETPLTGNALFNRITSGSFSGNPDITKSFVDKVEYNFETNLGPTSIARVPSVLDDWEIDNGYYLAPDEFGIDRKVKNGIMDSEDAGKVSVLKSAYDKAVHDAFTELQRETAGLPNQEGSKKPIVSVENEVSLLSKASYKSGILTGIGNKANQIPEGLRGICIALGPEVTPQKLNEIINRLSADGLIVVPIETDQGISLILIRELKNRYNMILKTTDDFERGRLVAELFVDVLSVFGSGEINIARFPSIANMLSESNLISMEFKKQPEIPIKYWTSSGHRTLIGVLGEGFTGEDIKRIIAGSEEADNKHPFNNALHAMPEATLDSIKAEFRKNMQLAIELQKQDDPSAMKYLGYALHTAQDFYSHYARGLLGGSWLAHEQAFTNPTIIPSGGPDNPANNPKLFEQAIVATTILGDIFLQGKSTGTVDEKLMDKIFQPSTILENIFGKSR